MKSKKSLTKLIGFGAMVLGFVATQISDYVQNKQIEELVDEKVNAALKDKNEES